MYLEFPYQLTTFLETEPVIGEPVYNGGNGWYAQIALKRRFKAVNITEDELIGKIIEYCNSKKSFTVATGELTQPQHMPVKIIEVGSTPELVSFHNDFISFLGDTMQSKFPERDGAHYLPHITAEYNGRMVIDDSRYTNRVFTVSKIFLLKDLTHEDSVAYKTFDLR